MDDPEASPQDLEASSLPEAKARADQSLYMCASRAGVC